MRRNSIVIGVLGILLLFNMLSGETGESEKYRGKKWEYKVVHMAELMNVENMDDLRDIFYESFSYDSDFEKIDKNNMLLEKSLIELGAEGWEYTGKKELMFIFKRQVQ